MFEAEETGPAILAVHGAFIRDRMLAHVASGRAAAIDYRAAHEAGRCPSVPWATFLSSCERALGAVEAMADMVAPGDQYMSIRQFEKLWNRFGEYKTADEVIAEEEQRTGPRAGALSKAEIAELKI